MEVIKLPSYAQHFKRVGSQTLADLIQTLSKTGDPVTLVVYTLFLPWVALVARKQNLPSAVLLIQNATSFSVYNRLFNSRDGIFVLNRDIGTSISLKLPGIPLFKWADFPTFALPTSPYFSNMVSGIQEQLQFLEVDPNPDCVLVNTIDGLEPDSVKSIPNATVIGPLVSLSFSGDRGSYFQWLDSKTQKSVVYVSFGRTAVLSKTQKAELLHGLKDFGRPFLLVLLDAGEEKELKETLGDRGLIVEWCSQMEVLRHPAIGCFVSHCGWNSTLEGMVAGVAVVGYPLQAEQRMNARMVEEVWGNGVRAVADEAMVVRSEEIKRCLEVVMDGGDKAEEINKMVEKWKKAAVESVKDGGSSHVNLKRFLESVHRSHSLADRKLS